MHPLEALGWDRYFDRQVTDDERARWAPARVVWEGRDGYRISTGDVEWQSGLAGRLRHTAESRTDLPAVGDWVLASLRAVEGRATIHRLLARRSRFSRAAAGRSTDGQILAANVDTVLLVTSVNHDFNLRRLERYLTLTWESGARPIVVLNKADLCRDPETWQAEIASMSQGVPILMTSALRGHGMTELREIVRTGGTTALLGSSGVGKSSLINTLVGERRQDVLTIRRSDDRGRHSTTARQLFLLADGGIVIDTPGLRELRLWDVETGLESAFADIQSLAAGCRFRDCTHGREPGCAVTAAVARGDVSADRLDSYHRLQRETDYMRSRDDASARSEHARKAKHIAKSVRLQYRLRRR